LRSVPLSVYDHVEEHGRTYHAYKDGKYVLPNDEREQDRLDRQHTIFKLLFEGKLAFAPTDKIALHHVLDIATGTGIWAIEFADAHPSAHVIGTDLSPIQPSSVPVNCTFEVDDAEDEWVYSHKFDYIHARGVVTCFRDAREVIRSAFNFLMPNGYLEFQDAVFPLDYAEPPPVDSAFVKLMALILDAVEKAGRPWTNAKHYSDWMRDTGFVDIVEHKLILPVGTWSENPKEKELGALHLENWLEGIGGMAPRILTRIGWEEEEVMVLLAHVRSELRNGRVKPYNVALNIWGRKPLVVGEEN